MLCSTTARASSNDRVYIQVWRLDFAPGDQTCRFYTWQKKSFIHDGFDDEERIPPCFVLWVRSILSDRRAKVQVGGSHSRSFRIRRGVPQGSVLGPVLFILFVDDITKDLPRGAHASLYADDLAIWSSSPDPLKASSVVQSSLTVLQTWFNLWRLPLNPKKCESFFSTDPHQATFQPRLNL